MATVQDLTSSSKETNPRLSPGAASVGAAIRAVVVDLDNTIVHEGEPAEGDVVLPPGRVRSATIRLLKQIAAAVPVVLVTGRRAAGFERLSETLPHSFAICENGAVIFEAKTGKLDWTGSDHRQLEVLWGLERTLKDKGYKTSKEGRSASFRIHKNKSQPTDEADLESLLPAGTRLVSNGPYWDFVLSAAGKENAVQHVLARLKIDSTNTAAVGDDLNDLELLAQSGLPMTFCDAHPKVVEVVATRRGYITEKHMHEGIVDILQHIMDLLGKQT